MTDEQLAALLKQAIDEQEEDALDDEPMPSPEEMEEFVRAVNAVVGAISGAVRSLSKTFVPALRAIYLMFLRMALARRLCAMWDNRHWHWLSWRIAWHTPDIFLTKLLPSKFLTGGLNRNTIEEKKKEDRR